MMRRRYTAMATAADIFQPLEKRARLAIGCFWAYMVVLTLMVISMIAAVSQEQNLYDDAELAPEGAVETAVLALMGVAAVLYIILLVLSIVAFLTWLYRARRNLPSLGIPAVRWSPGWAVAWWFIPIMSLFRPYQVVKETWQDSDPMIAPSEQPAADSSGFLRWWWALYLLHTTGGWVSDRYAATTSGTIDIATASLLTAIDVAFMIAGIGAAWLAIRMVREITARQRHRYQLKAFA